MISPLPEIQSIWPDIGNPIRYRAVGINNSGRVHILKAHYRSSMGAEYDADRLLYNKFPLVYVEQLVNGKVTGRWRHPYGIELNHKSE